MNGFSLENTELHGAVVKADLVDRVYKKVGFTRQEAVEAVETLFKEIKLVLGKGEDVCISGFAGFHLKNKKERNARDPRNGEPILICSRRVLTFKPSQKLLVSTNQLMHESKDT